MTLDKQTWQSMITDHLKESARPLIVIVGPTASGKTGLSLAICNEFDGEVINADSRQLFRGMDIGTAKVTKEEMGDIPHHLLDVLDPSEDVSAPWYQKKALETIDDILERGKLPVLVGGSMLYVATILDGLSFDESKRDELWSKDFDTTYDMLLLGLGKNREETVEKINNRTKQLFDAGWIEEVQCLLDAGYTEKDPGMKACGYKEIMRYLKSGGDLESLKESIAAKTRQYARRQMTWWKKDTRIQWIS